MGNAVFPSLPGLMFPVKKTPMFSTNIKTAVSGRELRRANYTLPLFTIGLQYEFLRDTVEQNEFKTLLAFFLARGGAFDSFLFNDPDDGRASNELLGIGDGVTTTFQLARSFGGFSEPVCNVANVAIGPNMWAVQGDTPMWTNDSAAMWSAAPNYLPGTDFNVSATGLVTFAVAPPAAAELRWSGEYYYRCRFLHDQQDYNKFMDRLWEQKKCDFIGTLGTRI